MSTIVLRSVKGSPLTNQEVDDNFSNLNSTKLEVSSPYAVGDIVYADTTTTFAKLPSVATGNALISGGVGTAPAWGKVGLTTHVSGILGIVNGGTGASTRQDAMDALAGAVTSGQYLRGNGTDVVMSAIQAADVPTLNQNTTGSAATLTTGRTISITGDVSYTSGSFDGSANVTGTGTLANSGVTAGTYTYSTVTVDAKGRVTSASSGASPSAFPSGTLMLFAQTAAPTGWTKSTTHDNKALRVVSGTASSGGTTAFSTVFSNQTPSITLSGLSAGATTLSTSQMPSHTHGGVYGGSASYGLASGVAGPVSTSTGATGGGGSHSHTVSGSASSSAITLNVQYVDVIIATKD